MDEILRQANAAGIEVSKIAFVAATTSFDHITESTKASLWSQSADGPQAGIETSLEEANKLALEASDAIAKAIEAGEIDGVIIVSGDHKTINNKALLAAAAKGIPVVGTGGTSMANTRALGAKVISASGTTGTTSRSRAVGYISALASEWKIKYSAVIGKQTEVDTGNVWKRINLRSIMMSSLPGFIAMALILAVGKIPFLAESVGPLFENWSVLCPSSLPLSLLNRSPDWTKSYHCWCCCWCALY